MLAEILAYNKSALCRSASPALSFVLYFNVIIKALITFSNCIMLRVKCKHVIFLLFCFQQALPSAKRNVDTQTHKTFQTPWKVILIIKKCLHFTSVMGLE